MSETKRGGERRGAETRVGLQTVQSPTALITCNGADDNYNNECREEQQKSEEKERRGEEDNSGTGQRIAFQVASLHSAQSEQQPEQNSREQS